MNIEILKHYKKNSGMTTEDIANRSGVPLGTINKIFRGETKNPQIDTIDRICRVLNCSLDYITDFVVPNKENVSYLTDTPSDILGNNSMKENAKPSPKLLPLLKTSCLYDADNIEYTLINNPPENADFAVKICDDSMFPLLKNGDTVFAKKTDILHNADIGVFRISGKIFVRKFNHLSLLALNNGYEPFMLNNSCALESVEGIIIK